MHGAETVRPDPRKSEAAPAALVVAEVRGEGLLLRHHIVVEGDTAGWLVRTTGTHTGEGLGFPPTGKSFETLSANLGILRDGRAAEHWAEQGMFPMLVQLGVIPVPSAV